MDNLFANAFMPSHQVGNDGFDWWCGQIEQRSEDDPAAKGNARFRVRIVGEHTQDQEVLAAADLPWATVMYPVTDPATIGNRKAASVGLEVGCWVVGFYLDPYRQKPIIMGSIGTLPGATQMMNESEPTVPAPAFTTFVNYNVNPHIDGLPTIVNENGKKVLATSEGTTNVNAEDVQTTGESSAPIKPGENYPRNDPDNPAGVTDTKAPQPAPASRPAAELLDQKKNECIEVAEKCGKEANMSEHFNTILGQMLFEIQNSNGNVGTSLVNRMTGEVGEVTGIVTKYTNKAIAIAQKFVAKVKGFVIEKLREGVEWLVDTLLRQDESGNALTPVTKWFNEQLKALGCSMADIGERLAKWLTDTIMGYVESLYRMAACQLDLLVGGIINKIQSLMDELLASILGPLQSILGAIASPLNLIGGAINFILDILGISCSGPDTTCADKRKECFNGEEEDEDDDENGLDKLLDELDKGIDDLFPETGRDDNIYTCPDAYEGNSLSNTNVGFIGGNQVPPGQGSAPGSGTGGTTTTPIPPTIIITEDDTFSYTCEPIEVKEGNIAVFTIVRSGALGLASSLKVKTIDGSAEHGTDYQKLDPTVVPFAPGQTQAKVEVMTFADTNPSEPDEVFYLKLKSLTPESGGGYYSLIPQNLIQCTITNIVSDAPPTPAQPGTIPEPNQGSNINPVETVNGLIPDTDDDDVLTPVNPQDPDSAKWGLSVDKNVVNEGEFVTFTVTTENVADGTEYYWNIFGSNITNTDIFGGELTGSGFIQNGEDKVVIGIAEDTEIEGEEILLFALSSKGLVEEVTINAQLDEGGDPNSPKPEDNVTNPTNPVKIKPTVPCEPITDGNGAIISIPVCETGDPWTNPPYIFIGGEGIGATATALLDGDGYLTEIRVTNGGYGYKKNRAETNGLRCIIDSFTMLRPGLGYTSPPLVFVDGKSDIAEAVINEDGFVVSLKIKDRTTTFASTPEVIIVGGEGYGAKFIPSLVCLDTEELEVVGSTKIGTGKYIDCP
jgi:hypothetical protein